jgi:hypothetical protein
VGFRTLVFGANKDESNGPLRPFNGPLTESR